MPRALAALVILGLSRPGLAEWPDEPIHLCQRDAILVGTARIPLARCPMPESTVSYRSEGSQVCEAGLWVEPPEPLRRCMAQAFRAARWCNRSTDTVIEATYPFIFLPGPRSRPRRSVAPYGLPSD